MKALAFYTGLTVVVTAEKGELAIEPQQKV
ncbi:hypothetical protein DTF36_17705 [Salmonella enterica subsp. enterica]|nr:hypothetical protein [Salmonella enterica subsp. enterica]EAQ4583892.1 hypothetical protein [Salmonella enterica]EBE9928001.1 hypothetical protein [Salmonella enterica]EDU7996575.1 hypothetical protein [Salmonella enterica subsp. diarizonae]MKP46108.1 hypothetical protein [Salmonella enterica subsp. enterica]